jgi:glycosyltransferase involved in cell wall biosynthesis
MSPPNLRVLMLSDVYFPRVNGVSTSIRTFRRDLEELGCESVLVAPDYPGRCTSAPGIQRVRSRYLPFDPEDRVMSGRALRRICAGIDGPFDLIHVQTPFVAHRQGVRLARRLGVPVVETYHTYFEQYFEHYVPVVPRAWLKAAARTLTRRQCNAVDAVVAPSREMALALTEYGAGTAIHVIPTGLDLSTVAGGQRERFRSAFGIGPDRPVMLTVGRVAHEKNIGFLVDVLECVRARLPRVLLVIAGEGPALPSLRRRVAKRGLADNVLFVGYLDRADALLDCYRAADVFVFASRTETQGLVLLEALALGTPVVSTAVMGTKTVLAGAGGALVVDEDLTSFADAIERVLKDPALRTSLAREAKAFVAEKWSSAEMARRMLDLYEQCVSRGKRQPLERASSV